MGLWLTGGINVSAESSATFTPGQWYHIVGVVDRVAKTTSIYVNGSLQRRFTWPSANETRQYDPSPWRIGVAAPGASTWSWPANATIDDVRVYNRALTIAEIGAVASGN